MEETSEELPNFSIEVDLLGPDPTSNKNKAEIKSQVACFANLSEDQLQQILAERHSLVTKKVTNWSLTIFKVKISVFTLLYVFKFTQTWGIMYTVVNWEFTKTKTIKAAKNLNLKPFLRKFWAFHSQLSVNWIKCSRSNQSIKCGVFLTSQ